MWNKEVGRSRVFVARNSRNWARLNPAEPHRAVGHLFSANASGSFCTLHSPSLPSPQRWNLVLKGFRVVLSQFLCPGLFPSCAVTSGCQQATTADTDGSPGLWWLPYVTSLLQVCAAFFFFFKCFSFHLSSLSPFGSLKWPEQGGRGECRRGWKGSNMMPINTFQCRARIQAQLEFYLFTEWLLGG